MAFVHAKNTKILIDGLDMSPFLQEASTSAKVDTPETTHFGLGAKTYIAGLQDGSLALKGMFDSTATTGPDVLMSTVLGRATDPVVTIGLEGSLAIAKRAASCLAVNSDYSISAPVANVVMFNANFQADGGVDTGYIVHDGTTSETATVAIASGTAVTDMGITTTGALFTVQVTAITGTLTNVVVGSATSSGGSYTTHATVAGPFTAVGAGSATIAIGTTINQFIKVGFTFTGTSCSFTGTLIRL